MAKTIKKRTFGGAPPVDFLDLSYLMPLLVSKAGKGTSEYPIKFGSPLKIASSFAQSMGRVPRSIVYEKLLRTLMPIEEEARDISGEKFANWVTSLYRGKTYPYIIFGPPIGSLAYLASVLDAPFLPLNFAVNIRRKPDLPDDIKSSVDQAKKWADYFLKRENNIQIVHEYDPVHMRHKIRHGSTLRFRYFNLPKAYDDFIRSHLRPKGYVMIVESRIGWRQYRLAENFYHQSGLPGGIPCEEYLFGSNRLNIFRSKFLQGEASYKMPLSDEIQPETRYGVIPNIRLALVNSANSHRRNICQLFTDDLYRINQLVSQLFVRCARREGKRPQYCYVHSGSFIAPSQCLQSTTIPLWVPSPSYNSYRFVKDFINKYPFDIDEIIVSFEPSVEGAPDYLMIERWKEMLSQKSKVRFIGMNPGKYPRQITSIFNYWNSVNTWAKRREQPLSIRVSTDIVVEEARKCGINFQITENAKKP